MCCVCCVSARIYLCLFRRNFVSIFLAVGEHRATESCLLECGQGIRLYGFSALACNLHLIKSQN